MNLQTNDEEKETKKSKGEHTFKIFITNGKDAQNGHRSRVEAIAQVNGKKEGKQFRNDWRIGESEGFQSQQLENGGKPKGRTADTPNHHVPGGHVVYNATTMHLIQSETLRGVDSPRKPFTFYDRHDVSWRP